MEPLNKKRQQARWVPVFLLCLGLFCLGWIVFLIVASVSHPAIANVPGPETASTIFPIQSIDTMKDSRDMAESELNDPGYDATIQSEMQLIKATGANYVAIDTPYDDQFAPFMTRWVNAARAEGLSIWFRGNFAGWEGWFNSSKITEAQHNDMLQVFITTHPDLFQNGDLFSPCPECENGQQGDPRSTGDAAGFNAFLVQEYDTANTAFHAIGKNVRVLNSMNSDIANQIITPSVASALGGTILVDHYVATPQEFLSDIAALEQKFNNSVGIGEFGAVIPGLQTDQSEGGQASFVGQVLAGLYAASTTPPLINYWTLEQGSTALINPDGSNRAAYGLILDYYSPYIVMGTVTAADGVGQSGVLITVSGTNYARQTDSKGYYRILVPRNFNNIVFSEPGFADATISPDAGTTTTSRNVILTAN